MQINIYVVQSLYNDIEIIQLYFCIGLNYGSNLVIV